MNLPVYTVLEMLQRKTVVTILVHAVHIYGGTND
jgi:hypothetical protein